MKKIYRITTKIKIHFTSGDSLSYKDVGDLRYGDIPKNEHCFRNKCGEQFPSEYFDELYSEFCKFRYDRYSMGETLFKKRQYIKDLFYFETRIYKDEIESCEYEKIYEIVNNATTKQLKEKLTFNEYSELVFDREKELKSLTVD